MRILVVGAGAVGGYFGAKLARAGQPVSFLARGETLRALRQHGLRIDSDVEGSVTVSPVEALAALDDSARFDLVLVTVKAPDTAGAIGGLGASLAPGAIVVSLQNGVESEEAIERALGIPPILRALAFIGAESTAPGVVRHVSGGTILVGELDGSRSARLERLEGILRGAGIDVSLPDDIRRAAWQKLAWNAAFNLIAALSEKSVAAIFAEPAGRLLLETVMAEVEAVAAAQGITFESDYIASVLRYSERHLGGVRPSTLQDRERGRPLEHDAITGAVCRFGERFGVSTPVCRTLDALARLVSQGG